MKLPVVVLVACAATVAASPSFADAKSEAKSQVEFGINVAQRGLWREAIYRWEKAVEIDPMYAQAYNDLGIGYEHEGSSAIATWDTTLGDMRTLHHGGTGESVFAIP